MDVLWFVCNAAIKLARLILLSARDAAARYGEAFTNSTQALKHSLVYYTPGHSRILGWSMAEQEVPACDILNVRREL